MIEMTEEELAELEQKMKERYGRRFHIEESGNG